MAMCSLAVSRSFAFVLTRTRLPMACLRVGVQTLFWVEFRAVAGQVEHLDLFLLSASHALTGLL